ncbi:MAG: hypothetical protein QM632_06735 [Micrococcaceae bacterium]
MEPEILNKWGGLIKVNSEQLLAFQFLYKQMGAEIAYRCLPYLRNCDYITQRLKMLEEAEIANPGIAIKVNVGGTALQLKHYPKFEYLYFSSIEALLSLESRGVPFESVKEIIRKTLEREDGQSRKSGVENLFCLTNCIENFSTYKAGKWVRNIPISIQSIFDVSPSLENAIACLLAIRDLDYNDEMVKAIQAMPSHQVLKNLRKVGVMSFSTNSKGSKSSRKKYASRREIRVLRIIYGDKIVEDLEDYSVSTEFEEKKQVTFNQYLALLEFRIEHGTLDIPPSLILTMAGIDQG